ncbi:NADH-Ubiquinone oxidoreductase B14 subunit [Pediculus humanus corporis]|uniref:NADH dehydrogenase [ubiquinone] 1 alpha subcomplex subunit 6 n=1 Tax=Pediculus humanus subsp. corporis TaxID=121224 RepID=E0VM54_PEDHC|nr:NADH-Ubiquinone oxidoreductase B14 subunit [Pediculus humanus corporis]EEB14460.1 NADH-Ubiquinone oxidoreductase B14 subunit [Pediculus humanus corporis]
MSAKPVQEVVKKVKPLLSLDNVEARRRVIMLYKAWYRAAPEIAVTFRLPISFEQVRKKIKEEFMKNKNVTDVRVIDLLVIKGQMELKETVKIWKQTNHVMYYMKDTNLPKPTNFISKFLQGSD